MATTTPGRSIVRPTTGSRTEVAPSRWAILGLVSVGTVMTTLDASIVNIALPFDGAMVRHPGERSRRMGRDRLPGGDRRHAPDVGRLADLVERIREDLGSPGIALFTAGSVLSGLSPTLVPP